MNEHLHNMDEIFRSAYQQFREEPTGEVWEKINAVLDKKDAQSNKRRALKGRQIFLFLLLLMAGLILYETIITRTSTANFKENSAITNVESIEKKKTSSELKETMSIGERKIYVEGQSAINKGSLTENKLPQNAESNKDAEKFATHFKQLTTPISLPEEIKTNFLVASKKIPYPPSLVVDNSVNIQPRHKNSKIAWTYTPFLSYEWAQYRIDSDLPAVNSIKQGNEHEPSFSAGVLLSGQFTEKWMFQSGIVYSNTTIDIAPQKIYAVQSPGGDYAYKYITSAGYGYIRPGFAASPALGDSLLTTEAEHTLRHITIPLAIKYKVGRGKFSIMPGAGIAANFLTGTKVETEIKNSTDKETVIITKLTGTKNLNWSLTADAEMQYQLNNKMSVNLRPAFRYAISSITRNDDFQTFPYAFGIGLGMTFKLQ
jgi:hypothetical protein